MALVRPGGHKAERTHPASRRDRNCATGRILETHPPVGTTGNRGGGTRVACAGHKVSSTPLESGELGGSGRPHWRTEEEFPRRLYAPEVDPAFRSIGAVTEGGTAISLEARCKHPSQKLAKPKGPEKRAR